MTCGSSTNGCSRIDMPLPPGLRTGLTAKLPGDWQKQPTPGMPQNRQTGPAKGTAGGTGKVSVSASSWPSVISFTVPGTPIGKPRMVNSDRWKKRPAVLRYWEWANSTRAAIGPVPPAKNIKLLEVSAFFEPPASWSKKKRYQAIGLPHCQKPDGSNILKAVEDILWPDGDQELSNGSYSKKWDWRARLEVTITLEKG